LSQRAPSASATASHGVGVGLEAAGRFCSGRSSVANMTPTVEYGVLDERERTEVVDEMLSVYRTYEWWADRDRGTWERALAETDELVVVRNDGAAGSDVEDAGDEENDGDVIAAARVLTDYVCYAMVYDVIVHADRRGEGVGRLLVEGVTTHPRLDDVDPSLLAREGLVAFYERCGFEDPTPIEHPEGEPEELHWLVDRSADENETERA